MREKEGKNGLKGKVTPNKIYSRNPYSIDSLELIKAFDYFMHTKYKKNTCPMTDGQGE